MYLLLYMYFGSKYKQIKISSVLFINKLLMRRKIPVGV